MAHQQLKRLDLEKTEIKTTYCATNDTREEQIAVAVSRVSGRIEASNIVRDEPVAIVCYGPSLKKTWQDVRQFKKVMTCSGAHKFLIDRGIVPTWHVDLDPREHKTRMLGAPHRDVEYLMASCCHPSMWDLLEGFNVKLWHIYHNEDNKDVPLQYPRGDWILTGGNNVGLRCLVVARMLGYKNLHVFGMDCSFPGDSGHHAGEHLNASKTVYEVPYNGKMFYCEPAMVTYARQFFHELNQLPDVKVMLHGDGLLQHMAAVKKNEKITLKKSANIAFSTPLTITPGHVEHCKKLHKDPLYGVGGKKHKEVVLKLARALDTHSIMDYGCGKGTLANHLPFPIWEYDPAIPGKDRVPRPADLVVCFNVLEHVEPQMLDNVLGDLVRCSRKCVFAVIETTQVSFWKEKLSEFFQIGTLIPHGSEIHCVLAPKALGPR